MRPRAALGDHGFVVSGRGQAMVIPYDEILTAERLRSHRGFDLHIRSSVDPVRVRCRRSNIERIEDGLRFMGVRVVDCWGAIVAPTYVDFIEELDLDPGHLRQSSDDARG